MENAAAQALGARRLPASGSKPYAGAQTAGADLVHPKALIEHKRTEKDVLQLQLRWLEVVRIAALRVGKAPALAVRFSNADLEMLFLPARYVLFRRELQTLKVTGYETTHHSIPLHSEAVRAAFQTEPPKVGAIFLSFRASDPEHGRWLGLSFLEARTLLEAA